MKKFPIALVVLIFCARTGWGDDFVWLGASTDWGDGNNWTNINSGYHAVPGPGDDVSIPGGRSNYPDFTSYPHDPSVKSLILEAGSRIILAPSTVLTVSGNISQDPAAVITGTGGTITGGTIALPGDNTLSAVTLNSAGDITLNNTATLTAVLTSTAGNITLTTTAATALTVTASAAGAGKGVAITAGGDLVIDGSGISAAGTVSLTAGGDLAIDGSGISAPAGTVSLDVNGAVSQTAAVSAGTLTVAAKNGISLGADNDAAAVTLNNNKAGAAGDIAYTSACSGGFMAEAQNNASGEPVEITNKAGILTVGTAGIRSTGGYITLNVDSGIGFSGTAPINAGTTKVAVRNISAGQTFDLGGTGADINIDGTFLSHVTAGILEIGQPAAGAITVTSASGISGGVETLVLRTGAGMPSGAGSVDIKNLAIQAAGNVTLSLTGVVNERIAVDTTAATSGGAISVTAPTGIIIGALGTLAGITGLDGLTCPAGQSITIDSGGGVSQDPTAPVITSGAGGVLTLDGTGSYDLSAAGTSNKVDSLRAGTAGSPGTSPVSVVYQDSGGFTVGDSSTGITTSGGAVSLTAGGTGTGSITVSKAVDTSGGAGGAVSITAGAGTAGDITVAAGAAVTTSGGAVSLTAGGTGSVTVAEAVTTSGGTVSLTAAAGSVAINAAVNAGTGVVTLKAGSAGISQTAAGLITTTGAAGGLVIRGTSGAVSLGEGNTVSRLDAATSGAAVTVKSTAALSLVPIETPANAAAVTTGGGNFSLTAPGITLASGKTVTTGTGTISLDSAAAAVALSGGTVTTTNTSAGAMTVVNAGTVTLGTVNVGGRLVLGTTALPVSGTVTQGSGTVRAASLTGVGQGSVTLGNTGNVIPSIAGYTLEAPAGSTAGAALMVSTTGALTVTAAISTEGTNPAAQTTDITLTAPGGIGVNAGITASEATGNTGKVVLSASGGAVSQAASVVIRGKELTVTARDGITLDEANIAVLVDLRNTGSTTGNVVYRSGTNFTINARNDVPGALDGSKGAITITAGAPMTLGSSGIITSNQGHITLVTDSAIGTTPGGIIDAPNAKVAFRNYTSGKTFDLDSGGSGDIQIDSNVLGLINSAKMLEIGSVTAGNVTVIGMPSSGLSIDTVVLWSGNGSVLFNSGITLPVAYLGVLAHNDVTLELDIANTNIAVKSDTGHISLSSAGTTALLTIDALAGRVGVSGLDGLRCGPGQYVSMDFNRPVSQNGSAPVIAGGLLLKNTAVSPDPGQVYTLNSAGENDITSLAANTQGNIIYKDKNSFAVAAVNSVNGVTTTGNVGLEAAGITQTQPVAAAGLLLKTSGTITLDHGSNAVGILAVAPSTASISFRNQGNLSVDGLTVGTITASGIVVSGSGTAAALTVDNGNLTQTATGLIKAPTLKLSGTGTGDFTLTQANEVGKLSAVKDGAALAFTNNVSLSIGDGTAGINTGSGAVTLDVNGAVSQTQPVVTTSTGPAGSGLIVMAATGINLTGTGNTADEVHLYNSTSGDIKYTDSGTTGTVAADALNNASGKTVEITATNASRTLSLGTSLGDWGSAPLDALPSASYSGIAIKANYSDITLTGDNITIGFGIDTSQIGPPGNKKKVAIRNATGGKTIHLGGSSNSSGSDIFIDETALNRMNADLLEVGRSGSNASGDISVESSVTSGFSTLILRTGAAVVPPLGGTINVTNLVIDAREAVSINVSGNANVAVKSGNGGITLSSTALAGFTIYPYVDPLNSANNISGLQCFAGQTIGITASGPVIQTAGTGAVPGGAPINAGSTGILSLNGTGSYTLAAVSNSSVPINQIGFLRAGTAGSPASSPSSVAYRDSDGFTVGSGGQGVTVNGGNVTLTAGGTGSITVNEAVATSGGNGNVTLTAGGSITVNEAVATSGGNGNVILTAGGSLAVNEAVATSGGNVTMTGGGTAGSITVASGATITTSGGAVSLTAGTTSGSVTVNAAITTTNAAGTSGGVVSLTAGTSGSISAGADITSGGTSSGGDVSFNRPVTLTAAVTVSTGAGPGNVRFAGTVNGSHALTVTAGAGTVTFTGPVGAGAALASLNVTGAGVIQLPSVFYNGVSLRTTGDITFGGPVAFLATPNGSDIPPSGGSTAEPTKLYVVIKTSGSSGTIDFQAAAGTAAVLRNLVISAGAYPNTWAVKFSGGAGDDVRVGAAGKDAGTTPELSQPRYYSLFIDAQALILGNDVDIYTSDEHYGHVYMKVDGLDFTYRGSNNLFTASGIGAAVGGDVQLTTRDVSTAIEYCTVESGDTPNTHRNYSLPTEYFSSEWQSVIARSYTLGDSSHTGIIYVTGVVNTRIPLTIENSGTIQFEKRDFSGMAPPYTDPAYAGYSSLDMPLILKTGGSGEIKMKGNTAVNLGSAPFGLAAKLTLENDGGSPTTAAITANGGIALMRNPGNSVGTIDGETSGNNRLTLASTGTVILGAPIGSTVPLGNVTVTSPAIKILPPDNGTVFITANNGTITLAGPVTTGGKSDLPAGLGGFVAGYGSGFDGVNVSLSIHSGGTPGAVTVGTSTNSVITLTGDFTLAAGTLSAGFDTTLSITTAGSAGIVNNGAISAKDVSGPTDPMAVADPGSFALDFNGAYSGTGSLNYGASGALPRYFAFRDSVDFSGSTNPIAGSGPENLWLVFLGSANQIFHSGGRDAPNVLIFHADNTTGVSPAVSVTQRWTTPSSPGPKLVIRRGFLDLDLTVSGLSWLISTNSSDTPSGGFNGKTGSLIMGNGTRLSTRNSFTASPPGPQDFILGIAPAAAFDGLSAITYAGDFSVGAGTGGIATLANARITRTGGGASGFPASTAAVPAVGALTVNGGALTLRNDLDTGYDITITGGGTLDAGAGAGRKIKVGRHWDQTAGTFVHRDSTVTFTGAKAEDFYSTGIKVIRISGVTTWYNFECRTPRLTIEFSTFDGPATAHRFVNKFTVRGAGETDRIVLTKRGLTAPWTWTAPWNSPWPTAYPNPAPSAPYHPLNDTPLTTAEYNKFWGLGVLPGGAGAIDMEWADVYYNYYDGLVPIPNYVRAHPWPRHFNAHWKYKKAFLYSFTEDADGNGRVDRIRVQSSVPIGGGAADFAGLEISVKDYEIDTSRGYNGYARAGSGDALRDTMYIYLKERDYNDGGEILEWRIEKNDSLNAEIGNFRIETEFDPMLTIDTVPPRVAYALMLPGRNELFIQLSEILVNSWGQEFLGVEVPGNIVDVLEQVSPREYLVTLRNSYPLTALALGTTRFSLKEFDRDGASPAPDLYDPSEPSMFVSPKYPADWTYRSYLTVRGEGTSVKPYTDAYGNPIGDGGNYAMIPPNRLPPQSRRDPKYYHPVTDILISQPPAGAGDDQFFVWPLWAKDNETTPAPLDGSIWGEPDIQFGLIWDFTGKASLQDRDITLQARLHKDLSAFSPELYYAGAVPDEFRARDVHGPEGFWLPPFNQPNFNNIVPKPYTPASRGLKRGVAPGLFNFGLSGDAYFDLSMVEFYFLLNGGAVPLYAARLNIPRGGEVPPDWYRRIRPFSFAIHNITLQRSGVTILNNVIDPTRGERTYIDYRLNRSGRVTIQVFTLDGTLVQILQRGSQNSGEYRTSWDGKNRGGRAVARGMYFIRVVGPEIDEIRKVMVVK